MITNPAADLPQLAGGVFLTDGGIETTLIFHDGFELPHFASFDLLHDPRGRDALVRYYESYIAVAKAGGIGFILDTPTWRASADWGDKLGYDRDAIAAVNRRSVELMCDLRARHQDRDTRMVVSGCVGPRGDGYDPGRFMSAREAQTYHAHQIGAFADAGADMTTAITMTNTNEAIGIARAAAAAKMPSAISFTVETDGHLPTGQPLKDAITQVDAETQSARPAYYMINCAHPSHFADALEPAPWAQRIRGIRANASRCSHAELDEAEDLDTGDPAELAADYATLRALFPWITILGGCCGTDHRHIAHITQTCLAPAA